MSDSPGPLEALAEALAELATFLTVNVFGPTPTNAPQLEAKGAGTSPDDSTVGYNATAADSGQQRPAYSKGIDHAYQC